MSEFDRYAVYVAPTGPLAEFAASWLGWDSINGATVTHPDIDGLPIPIEDITKTPRKYGFHATIKPPFHLADGSTPETLMADLARLADRQSPVTLDRLELVQLGRFLAITAQGDLTHVNDLAADVVTGLDQHRRPATDEELGRRRTRNLTSRQNELLMTWGYPHVLDQFKFHMTLTGKLSKNDASVVMDVLQPIFAPLVSKPLVISELCLFGQAKDERFHLVRRFPLAVG